jgi:hypothetical protein
MVSKVITKTTKTVTTTKTTNTKAQKKNDTQGTSFHDQRSSGKTTSSSQSMHDTIKLQKKLNSSWEKAMKKAMEQHPEQFEVK